MKLLPSAFVAFVSHATAVAADNTNPSSSNYPMADAISCKLMVRGVLNPALASLDLPKLEVAACACVDGKLRNDPIMVTLFSKDEEAKKKLIARENLQTYMIAKGMSYTFSCLAPLLGDGADRTFKQ